MCTGNKRSAAVEQDRAQGSRRQGVTIEVALFRSLRAAAY